MTVPAASLILNQDQEAAARAIFQFLLSDDKQFSLSGPAGTGKTTLMKHVMASLLSEYEDACKLLGVNPPYDRQQIEEGDTATKRKGGWVRKADEIVGGAKAEERGERAIFEDFLEPARKASAGGYLTTIYNDYVYFWRWALWRLFEQQECGGIVTFITASSYLAGPGFVGMREVMRRTFDELWIIDLGGDSIGTRKSPNVFNIMTPVAIAIGVRGATPSPNTPARVHYTKVHGETRNAKLGKLEDIDGLSVLPWRDCPSEWHKPFLPEGKGDFFEWPTLDRLFPYRLLGALFFRNWPIAETETVLLSRWARLMEASIEERRKLFHETGGWTIDKKVREGLPGASELTLRVAKKDSSPPKIRRYSFRAFDRQYAFYDFRLGNRLGPILYQIHSKAQTFLVAPIDYSPATGQCILATPDIPDLHVFCARGRKDIVPLYRDADATEPNVTAGLLARLSAAYGVEVTAEDLAAYVYALLGGQSYTRRFWNELETPGPRVPLTRDGALFARAAGLGRRLIWLHTYAERFRDEDRGDEVPPGTARCIAPVPDDPARYPERFEYLPPSRELIVGEGRFGPVAPEVWEFEVSGLKVVQSWLGYRMRERAGKKSSPLDAIRPERWTPRMTDELLELLWVLEATLAMEPELAATLDAVVAGDCFTAAELPQPTEEERKPPRVGVQVAEQASLFEEPDEA